VAERVRFVIILMDHAVAYVRLLSIVKVGCSADQSSRGMSVVVDPGVREYRLSFYI
jgi:hypothetical protein